MRTRSIILGYVTLTLLLTAGAAQGLSGSNTVFTDDIAPGAVTFSDINEDAVTSSRIAPGSVFSSDIADNAVSGTDINEASIPGFKKVFFSRVSSLGTQIGGNATSVSHGSAGNYTVTFPGSLSQCAISTTVASFSDNPVGNVFQHGNIATVKVSSSSTSTAEVAVITNAGSFTDLSFAVIAVCP